MVSGVAESQGQEETLYEKRAENQQTEFDSSSSNQRHHDACYLQKQHDQDTGTESVE